MGFMRSKIWVLLLLGSLIFSCSNSDSNEINIEEEFGSLPQINNSKNKAIELRISKCSFEGHVSNGNSIYKATITKEGVKLLLGSKLTCDYKNGAYIKEIENTRSNYWLNAVILKDKIARDEFVEHTNSNGVMTRPIWALMNKLEMFKNCPKSDLTHSEWLEERVVNIPSSVRF